MEITIEFFAYLTNYSPTGEERVTLLLKNGTTLKDLLEKLRIPSKLEKICLINGVYSLEDKILKEGDTISFYPMVDGG
jgi:molybdopterin converting factor small subunit